MGPMASTWLISMIPSRSIAVTTSAMVSNSTMVMTGDHCFLLGLGRLDCSYFLSIMGNVAPKI